MQRTTQNWADITTAPNGKELQARLNDAIIIQRKFFKVRRLGYKTRLEIFPEILNKNRSYINDINFEKQIFDIQKVYKAIAKWQFIRQLSKTGQFSLYKQVYYIDYKRAKTYVVIKLNIEYLKWEVADTNGNIIKTIKIKNFELDNILNLTICQRTKKKE